MKNSFLENMAPNSQRAFFIAGVFGVVAAMLYMFAVTNEETALGKTNAAYQEEEGNKARIEMILRNATVEKANLDATVAKIGEYRKAFLERRLGNYATHAREVLDPLAIGAGLKEIDYPESSVRLLPLPNPLAPSLPAQLHQRVAVKMTARGSYQSAVSFILRVEEEMPLVSVQSLHISASRTDPRRQEIAVVFEWPALGPSIASAQPKARR